MATPVNPPLSAMNLLINTRTVPKIVFLPAASTIGAGRLLSITDMCGNAGVSSIFISTVGRDSFDGRNFASTSHALLSTNFQSVLLASDGLLNWMILQNYNTNVVPRKVPFTPRVISSLTLWYDPTDSTTITRSGASVSAWNDKSGNGWNLTTQNGSPQYSATLINNLPGMDLTNSSGFISSSNPTLSANCTLAMILVVKSGIAAWGSFFTHGSRDNDVALERNSINAGTTLLHFQTANDNSTGDLTYTVDQVAIYYGTLTAGTSRFFERFGGGTTNSTTATNSSTIGSGPATIRIGRSDVGENANSHIGEVIYYSKVLSTAESEQIEGYLAWKWGLQSSLPLNHPFKNAAP